MAFIAKRKGTGERIDLTMIEHPREVLVDCGIAVEQLWWYFGAG